MGKIGEIYTKNVDAFMIFVTWYETKDVDGFIYNNLFYSVAHKLLILRQNAIFTYFSMHTKIAPQGYHFYAWQNVVHF